MTKEERRRSKDDAWVDILVASHSRRAGNQDAEIRRPGGPRPRNASRPGPDPEVASQEVAQVLAGVRGPSPLFDGESVDIEPMNIPHRSKIDSRGSPIDEIFVPTIPGSVDIVVPEEIQQVELTRAQRRMGYFDMHPERRPTQVDADEGLLDQFASAAGTIEGIPRRSDGTESVYSSGSTPPASPKLTKLNTQHLQPQLPISPPSAPAAPSPSPQAPSPRDLQRQQEVRDRLSGKSGVKASSLIEMYREKERQVSSGSSPGKSSAATEAQPQRSTPAAKESTPLPPPPPPPELSLSPLDTASLGTEEDIEGGENDGFIEAPNFELDHGRESPFRYVHGAPLHNVVEEEEEE
jgi:hypothetical protein